MNVTKSENNNKSETSFNDSKGNKVMECSILNIKCRNDNEGTSVTAFTHVAPWKRHEICYIHTFRITRLHQTLTPQ